MNVHSAPSARRLPWLAVFGTVAGVELARARRLGRMAAALAAAEEQAHSDPLTGLHNRAGMGTRVEAAFTRHGVAGLLLVDLDGLKGINDGHGHGAGDAVLAEVGRRLAAALLPGEMAARHGGDEFSVLLTAVSIAAPHAWMRRRAEAVTAAVGGPFALTPAGPVIDVSVSVGAAVATGAAELWEAADAAMYAVKRAHHEAARTRAGVAR